jgi:hypothetical protein
MVLRSSALLLLLPLLTSTALAQAVDPRAPGAIALPELGRLAGTLKQVTAVDERFGRQIYAIGDVDGDSLADWVLTHRRCDTSINGHAAMELLLYHGVRGGLPSTSDGVRIGPTEIGADCSFIGAGDYDGDGHRDIAISQRILDDPYSGEFSFSSIVVFWNDGSGRFSCADTTHLTAPDQRVCIMFPDDERYAHAPQQCDIDRDGAEDLVVVTYGAVRVASVRSSFPWIVIYRGHRGGRWGRNGVSTRPDWEFWQRLFTRRVSVVDHDGDGALDIALYVDEGIIGRRGGMSILYGRRGAMPDTSGVSIDFARVDGQDGKQGQLIDLTGDRVPELIVSTGDAPDGATSRWQVYVGRRGQRLHEQYGSGDDPPQPDDSLWWGRPWTQIWTPNHFSQGWSDPSEAVLDPGDIGLDGIGDFCAGSYPTLVCYNGGGGLDSWIDAQINVWLADDVVSQGQLTLLGDIDGSRRVAIGAPFDGGGVRFFAPSAAVPRWGEPIRLPEGSDRPLSTPLAGSSRGVPPTLTIMPNPTTSRARVRFSGLTASSIALLDLRGRELRRWAMPSGIDALTIDLHGMPPGTYLVTVRSRGRNTTAPLTLAP